MTRDEILAADVEKRLTKLKGKTKEELTKGADSVLALLTPDGLPHGSIGLEDVRSDVVKAVMQLQLDCDQGFGSSRIQSSLQNAILAATRWRDESRKN